MEDDRIGMQKSPIKVEEEDASASGGRGVINQFIHNIASCEKGVSNGDADETEHGTGGRGGIFENLITNLTSPRTPKPAHVNFYDGGGVIHRLVSHIPENEEAPVLMQSAIRD